jgi:lysophospholipase L1-like esterase
MSSDLLGVGSSRRLGHFQRELTPAILAILAYTIGGFQHVSSAPSHGGSRENWVGTWSMSPMPANALPDGENVGFTNQTIREVAHISIGGHQLRVRLSNAYGRGPVRVGTAHVALHTQGSSIDPRSDRVLRFNGETAVVIPAGAFVLSDAVPMDVAPLADLSISLYLPDASGPLTWHQLATQTTYISPPGDVAAATDIPGAATSSSVYLLAGIEVIAPEATGAVVALGDSITDGYGSTPDAARRWPDYLSRRLAGSSKHAAMAVLNAGISGNRLLHDVIGPEALARFDRDVLAQPGVTHIIVLEGINDIGLPGYLQRPAEAVSSEDLISALDEFIERAHSRGLRIYGATLTPFEQSGEPYYSAEGEAKRQALNTWIRTRAPFDAVIDFDRVLRDPEHPTHLLPAFDCGDHLHPNDAGYEAMAASIDLGLLQTAARR